MVFNNSWQPQLTDLVCWSGAGSQIFQVNAYLADKWNLEGSTDSDEDGIVDSTDDTPAGLIHVPKPVEFQIAFNDTAGNQGTTIVQTSDNQTVGIDTSSPEFTRVSMVSDNLDNFTAKHGDTVTLSFSTSEPIQHPISSLVTIIGLDPLFNDNA